MTDADNERSVQKGGIMRTPNQSSQVLSAAAVPSCLSRHTGSETGQAGLRTRLVRFYK